MPHHIEKTPKTATRTLGIYMIVAFLLAFALAAAWVADARLVVTTDCRA